MKVLQIPVGQMANFTYIIADDEETDEAAVIDPSWDLDKVFDALKKNGWTAKYVINTHSHFDHVLGNEQVAKVTGAKIVQHKASMLERDIEVEDGDTIKVGSSISLRVVHTPGHSKDSMCLVLDGKLVFTGDTLFVGNCGRTDLPGSDPAEMYDSLFGKVAKLDESLVMYPGHDYGQKPTSTIGHEKKFNYVLSPRTKQEFLEFMGSGD
ncbi:MBL fold metallo-hydrolase [Nitrososphaera viennensis]|uniref:Beta-lactamase-like protein n=2 Tax=Nitrososphaera viennensis TaxID=1034015 RepID=A0A060HLI7_9ARCH|nr:MBL fold metallo-hydrolase [Nitrososphaera viennensis]AIC14421.1 beta-lactamase-like protein [Nitrososphaera viennensis EN76]UVS69402.1 MBL fold metallo-hydrolase [Nitrososphaera viennensis]